MVGWLDGGWLDGWVIGWMSGWVDVSIGGRGGFISATAVPHFGSADSVCQMGSGGHEITATQVDKYSLY